MADRAAAYFCPACAEKLVLRRGLIKIPHFGHRPNTSCHFGAGESERHLLFKERVAKAFSQARIGRVEIEWPLGDRVADILVETPQGKAAVEFQASPITLGRIIERTQGYGRAGAHVLWVLDEDLFRCESPLAPGVATEGRVPSTFRFLARLYYGRVYVYTKMGKILPVRGEEIRPRARWVLGEAAPVYGRPFTRKWRMRLCAGPRLPGPRLLLAETRVEGFGDFRIARFYDKAFWK